MKKMVGLCLLSSTLLLAACDDKSSQTPAPSPDNSTQQQNAASGSPAATPAPAPQKSERQKIAELSGKISDYTRADNDLIDKSSEWRQSAEVAKKGNYKVMGGNVGWGAWMPESILRNLNNAIDKNPEPVIPELDRKAALLRDNLKTLLPQWKELESYAKAKRYEDDKGVQAKAMMQEFLKTFTEFETLSKDFSAELAQQRNVLKVEMRKIYEAEGKFVQINTDDAIASARQLINLFHSGKDLKNDKKYQEADALLQEMEGKIDAARKAIEQAKADGKKVDSYYESVLNHLDRFSGRYRSLKKIRNVQEMQFLIGIFNDTIGSYNSIRERS